MYSYFVKINGKGFSLVNLAHGFNFGHAYSLLHKLSKVFYYILLDNWTFSRMIRFDINHIQTNKVIQRQVFIQFSPNDYFILRVGRKFY